MPKLFQPPFPAKFLIPAILSCFLALPRTTEAVQPLPDNWPVSPADVDTSGFALILGGGGARGIAHIGVIEVLEELGMRPSLIVGTSMGSVVGSLYASGLSSTELKQLALSQDLLEIVIDLDSPVAHLQGGWWDPAPHQLCLQINQWPPNLGTGFVRGQSFESMVGSSTGNALFVANSDFDYLPIPFRCLSTDLVNSSLVVHEKGFLARAVRASSTIPLVFYPVEMEGKQLLDGGLLDNVPVQVARRLGFSRAVLVDVSNTHLKDKEEPKDLYEMLIRVSELQTLFPNNYQVGENDVLLKMPLGQYRGMNMAAAPEILAVGYKTALQHKKELMALRDACGPIVSMGPPETPNVGPITIESIEVQGLKRLHGDRVLDRLRMHSGDHLDIDSAWQKAEWLAQDGSFHNIGLEFKPISPNTAKVIVHVREETKPRLELGASFITDDGPAIMARLRFDNLLGRGGSNLLSYRFSDRQSRLDALLEQPLNGPDWVSLRARFLWQRERPGIYNSGVQEDRFVFRRIQASLDLVVRALDFGWSLYLGGDAGQTNSYLESRQISGQGTKPLRSVHISLESHGRDLPVSRSYQGMRLRHTRSFAEENDEPKWWRTDLGLVLPVHGLGAWKPIFATGAVLSSENIPVIHQGRAGGPRGWIGLHQQEIIAPQIAWSRIALQRLISAQVYVEIAGSVGWQGETSLSGVQPLWGAGLELGANSFIGPLRIGYAVTDLHPGYVYLQVGHEF